MKRFAPSFFAMLLSATAAHAADATFYLGTYTKPGKSDGIYVGKIDLETGQLSPLKLAAAAKNPSFVALSPNGKNLYAAVEGSSGAVDAFTVESDGTLQALNQGDTGGAGTCHVWVDATGGNVLSANYTSGSIAIFKTKPDGSLGERSTFLQYTGSGPDPKRQDKSYAHSIYTDAANKFVYSADLGSDNIWTFHFDATKGTLTPATPPSGKVPPGSGPRHVAIHPNGKFAYVNSEMALTVTAFNRNETTGELQEIETISSLPPGTPNKGLSAAEIFCHPNGKFLYASNRTHGTIAVFSIAADGKIQLVEVAPAGVQVPRGFALDPTGHWLIAAGQNEDKIAVLKIDQETGKLTLTGETAAVGLPVCVLFAPVK